MDEIKSNLLEIKEYTMDRLKMPIFFYYFVLLAVWNWDIILLILKSNDTIECIIEKIKSDKFDSGRYLCPLGIAIVGNIIFPFMMLGVDIPLTWINKQRNKKASEVESAKAEDEFTIQQKKTGGATLAALNTQIEVLNKDKITLTKTLEDTSKGLSENENTLAENSKIIYIKENKIRELEQQLISFNHPIGHNNIDEEISSFNDVLGFFIGNGGDKEDIHSTLRKISNEGNSTPLMVIQSWINYEDFIQKNIIIQKEINGIPYVELLPYGIKFMYWLEGFLSNNSVKDEGDGIEELNKEIDDLVEYSVSEKYNVEKIYNKFLELGIVDSYQKDMIMIKEEKPIPSNRLNFREYLRYDLIKVKKIGVAGARFYELTVLGESLFTYIVQKEL